MLNQMPNAFDLIGFLDDGLPVGSLVDDVQILGGTEWLKTCPNDVKVVVAIGTPSTKQSAIKKIRPEWNVQFANVIHPQALIQDPARVKWGGGCIICAGSILTTGITIGNHVLINLNVTIGHDSKIGDCSSVMPGVNIAGHVTMGQSVLIGSGANILNNNSVGDNATIGAASVVNHDVPSDVTAVGIPARIIKKA